MTRELYCAICIKDILRAGKTFREATPGRAIATVRGVSVCDEHIETAITTALTAAAPQPEPEVAAFVFDDSLAADLQWLFGLGLLSASPPIQGTPGVKLNDESIRAVTSLIGAVVTVCKDTPIGKPLAAAGHEFLLLLGRVLNDVSHSREEL